MQSRNSENGFVVDLRRPRLRSGASLGRLTRAKLFPCRMFMTILYTVLHRFSKPQAQIFACRSREAILSSFSGGLQNGEGGF